MSSILREEANLVTATDYSCLENVRGKRTKLDRHFRISISVEVLDSQI